jgi:phenylalanyl-tRNA synthetase alpha subunit
MPVKKIISAAAKAAAKKAGKKAGKKSKVISSKQMTKRLDDKVKAKKFGQSLTEFRKSERLLDKMGKLSPSSSQYKKLQDKFMDVKVPSKDPFPFTKQAIKKPRRLKPIPGTRRPKKQFGGTVYNNRGMKVPGMRYEN